MKRHLLFLLMFLGIFTGARAQDMTATPLTFQAVEDGTITVAVGQYTVLDGIAIQYKLNDENWTDVTWNEDITVVAGDIVAFHGDNNSCNDDYGSGFYFVCSNDCYVYGNVMSLLSSTEFATTTELTVEYAFGGLFSNDWTPNTTIKNHPTNDIVLPATTLSDYCYNSMFNACEGLTRAPELPATVLADYCYNDMFNGCTGLIAAPALPATDLNGALGCYTFMFTGCSNLTTAPELPATVLDTMCYDGIFMNCTSLMNAPELPATTLVSGCYSEMFMGCTSLETAPVLSATTLEEYCYNMMFNGCTGLNNVTCLATDISAESCTNGWLTDVAATGTFVKAAGTDWSEKVPTLDYWGDTQINGIPEGWTVLDYTPEPTFDPYSTPLTVEAIQSGSIRFTNKASGVVTYRVNDGEEQTINANAYNNIAVEAGDKVTFFGNNAVYGGSYMYNSSGIGSSNTDFYVYGNIMSLVDATNFATATTLTGSYAFAYFFYYSSNNTHLQSHPTKDLVLPATTLTSYCYYEMFEHNKSLTRAPELPALTVAENCYSEMFYNCTSLVNAPALPATTLAEGCYGGMFGNCSSLVNAPALPAETCAFRCYQAMFHGCTSLALAPALSATTLAGECYYRMFKGCTSLTAAPALSASTLESSCYYAMFDGCTSLTTVPELPATTLAGSCYSYMFNGCTGLTTAPELSATTLANGCYAGMFYDCTNLTVAPVLPATEMQNGCYRNMFTNCTSLATAPVLPATATAQNCYNQMFTGCTSLTVAPQLPATTTAQNCYEEMFKGCTSLTTAPMLPAMTMTDYCYQSMFEGCTSLTTAPELPATTLATCCYKSMFLNCTNLTTAATVLPADSLANYCYSNMFQGCTSLTTAPTLSATTFNYYSCNGMFSGCTNLTTVPDFSCTTLGNYCCNQMFYGCTNLTKAPALPATTLANYCYYQMFQNCTSLTKAPDLPAPTLLQRCYLRMFNNCTNLNYVKCLATNISATACLNFWLSGVAAEGTFVKAAEMTSWPTGTSGIPEGWTVKDDMTTVPLTFEAVEAGTIIIENPNGLTIEYNKNNTGWTSTSADPISIAVDANDVVEFRGNNSCYWASGNNGETPTRFTATNPCYVYGNVMSLVHADDFATNFTLNDSEALAYLFAAPTNEQYMFYGNNTTLQNHPSKDIVLPATTVPADGYMYMFAGCQGLTRTPELPATTIGMGSYHQMFADCAGLVTAPEELPATTLALSCYSSMFFGCSSLQDAPALPATTLADGCYMGMFEGCSSLETAPELPATTLSDWCYMGMFTGCTSLITAPALPATILTEDCYHRMFEGCTSLTKAPDLPAATLFGQVYGGMFDGCTSLNYVKCLATDLGENVGNYSSVAEWLNNVSPTGTFVKDPDMNDWLIGTIDGIPAGWTVYDKIFQTNGDWNVAANWNINQVPDDGSSVVIEANVIVPSDYVANAGSIVLNGGTITIADGGQLYHNNEGVTATIEKVITAYDPNAEPSDGWHLIGYSFAENGAVAEMTNLTVNNYDLYYYDESTHYWKNHKNTDNSFTELVAAKGYLYANSQTQTIGLKGILETANATVNVPLDYTDGIALAGFNLVGNPFAHKITTYTGTNVATECYRINGTGTDLIVDNISETNPLKPGEGFFVKATAENASITFNPTAKGRVEAPELVEGLTIQLDLLQNGLIIDRLIVKKGGEPLEKLTLRENGTRIFAKRDNQEMAVVPIEGNEQAVNFKAAKNGTYTISVNLEGIEMDYLHLIDNLTGADVDLLVPVLVEGTASYTFTAKTSDYASRFRLVFSPNCGDADGDNATFAYYNGSEWVVSNLGEATLQVIDMTGRILRSETINGNVLLNTDNISSGVYVVRLVSGDDVKTQKILVK